MPLLDYQERVIRLQMALAKAWVKDPALLNVPGRSIACKLDPNYYLAAQPFFDQELGRAAGMFPDQVAEALVKTGLFITRPPERIHTIIAGLIYAGSSLSMPVSFVDAEFIDQALRHYGGASSGLAVAPLSLAAESREAVETLFENKTPPDKVAYFSARQ
ncbi:MAG: hypothetical protein KKC99_10500 [Proteobacteria bacterium]|nr:hypothetical protein [Pseudomonadota bacterium]